MKILEQVKELVGGTTVYDAPYEKDGMTVIAASRVMGGGGGGEMGKDAGEAPGGAGGGVGLDARPAGAFVIKGDDVSWIPAMDINRIVLGGQLVAIIALLSWRSVAKARARARR
ncbi:MAG: sporulation protein [Chloroflexi bacterium]|nr:MAG: sporulation protein [Chloroflexota bacterium]